MIEAKKIAIIGGSGTGKTTLAMNLEKELHLSTMHIDGVHHLKNWEIRDKEERDQIILEKVQTSAWIIDGTYTSTLEERVKNAELVIYLDYSSLAQCKGVLQRYLKNPGKEKPEIPGCDERMSWDFFKWVWNWRKNKREKVLKAISQVDSNKVLIFKSRRELNQWYYHNFHHKMKI